MVTTKTSVVVYLLSLFLLLLSVPAFLASNHFLQRDLHGDDGGAMASFGVGVLLVAASIAVFFTTRTGRQANCSGIFPKRRYFMRMISFCALPIGLVAIWGGALSLWDAVLLINQEYLQWFPTKPFRSFGDSSVKARIFLEYLPLGVLSSALGVFLLSFVGSKVYRRYVHAGLSSAEDVNRPYSSPGA